LNSARDHLKACTSGCGKESVIDSIGKLKWSLQCPANSHLTCYNFLSRDNLQKFSGITTQKLSGSECPALNPTFHTCAFSVVLYSQYLRSCNLSTCTWHCMAALSAGRAALSLAKVMTFIKSKLIVVRERGLIPFQPGLQIEHSENQLICQSLLQVVKGVVKLPKKLPSRTISGQGSTLDNFLVYS